VARASGLDVVHVSHVQKLLGAPASTSGHSTAFDEEVASWCVANESILVIIDTDMSARDSRSAALRDAGVEVICFVSELLGVEPQQQAITRCHPGWEAALHRVDRFPRVWIQRNRGRPVPLNPRQKQTRQATNAHALEGPRTPRSSAIRQTKRRKRIIGEQSIYGYRFEWLPGTTVLGRPDVLNAASALYSAHYGRWGPGGRRPGEWIRMSSNQLATELLGQDTCMALAWRDGELVGYCLAVRFELADAGRIVWVSQLVVHRDHRDYGIGTNLLYSVWQFSDCFAWGLATANPRAVRALERATRRRVDAGVVRDNAPRLLPALQQHVRYIPGSLVVERGRPAPRVDTEFHIDLSEMATLRSLSIVPGRRWQLGALPSGQEWFACTFRSQMPEVISAERLDELLHGADQIWIDAYERMILSEGHAWRDHAPSETEYLVQVAELQPSSHVLDVGCGDGRHVEVFRDLGHRVVGTDISSGLIARAKERLGDRVDLRVADARSDDLGGPFDLVVCLYDVVGSSGRSADDEAMLRNLKRSLSQGGTLVVGAMNAHVTLDRVPAENLPRNAGDFVARLEALPPSNAMETTGQVFDASRIVVFNGVHYRKEQFELAADRLPIEAVIRDLRYTPEELADLFSRAGMPNPTVRPVRLGRWSSAEDLDPHDEQAKELLAIWRRDA